MADGTFQAVPKLFCQLYTINGYKNRTTIPLIYILMTNRTTNSYNEMLQMLQHNNPDLNPYSILIDFEKTFETAFNDKFPQIKDKRKLFSLSTCLWQKVQENGLQELYSGNVEFSLQVRHLAALAFVRTIKVKNYFEKLVDSTYFVNYENNLSTLVSYFEDTFLDRPRRFRLRFKITITPMSYKTPLSWTYYLKQVHKVN